jgi:hypothetical protein
VGDSNHLGGEESEIGGNKSKGAACPFARIN